MQEYCNNSSTDEIVSSETSHGKENLNLDRFYVILTHVAKKQNIGMMLRSACAFGVCEILVAGSKKHTNFFGAQGTEKHSSIRYFDGLKLAVDYARSMGCIVYGVEIKSGAKSVLEYPYMPGNNVAFMFGNEGDGLSDVQCTFCDQFVYIPQYGDGTASLNVAVAASIIFSGFANWAKYPERSREGEKFLVKPVPQKRGAETEEDLEKQRLRREKKMKENKAAEVGDFK